MDDDRIRQELLDDLVAGRLTRRKLLKRATALGLSAPAIAALLAACGSDDDDDEPSATEASSDSTETEASSGSDSTEEPTEESTEAETTEEEDAEGEATEEESSEGSADGEPVHGGHLTIAPPADIVGFDIRTRTDIPTLSVTELVFQSLVRLETDQSTQPFLATEWTISEDVKTFTFTLREGVTFHDGSPFTADDVVFTFESMLDPDFPSAAAGNFGGISEINKIDDFTVEFVLSSPDAEFILKLCRQGIVPKAYVEEVGDDEFNVNPIGTGPYKFVEWIPEERVELVRYDDYWNAPLPYIDGLTYTPITEESVLIAAIETGEVELIQRAVPPEQAPVLDATEGIVVEFYPYLYGHYIVLNEMRIESFKEKAVRQAIAYSIDREAITDVLGSGTPGKGPLPLASAYFNPDLPYYTYDPEKAKQILDEAGIDPADVSFTLQTFTYPDYQRVGEMAHEMLKAAGFNVELATDEWTVVRDKCYLPQAECDAMNSGIGGPGPDSLYEQFHSEGSSNMAFYSNPKVDELLEKGRATMDPDERHEIYDEVVTLILEDSPRIFVNDQDLPTVYWEYLKGFESNPHLSFMQLDRAWIDQDLKSQLNP